MVRSASATVLEELRNPTSSIAQIAALKDVKNELTGHDQRKVVAIRQGLLISLVQTLEASARADGKKRTQETNGHTNRPVGFSEWSDEEELRLQTLMVMEGIAQGTSAQSHRGRAS